MTGFRRFGFGRKEVKVLNEDQIKERNNLIFEAQAYILEIKEMFDRDHKIFDPIYGLNMNDQDRIKILAGKADLALDKAISTYL